MKPWTDLSQILTGELGRTIELFSAGFNNYDLSGLTLKGQSWVLKLYTVKPLITNTSEEFIKCRLDNF